MIKRLGIDISYHQGEIDFHEVKKAGVDFAIIREGYRDSTDKRFFEYVKGCKEAGIEILGIYHFSYALNGEEAKKEAWLAVENALKAELVISNIYIFFDFEYDTVKKAALKGIQLGAEQCNWHTEAFCQEVERLGGKPGVYMNKDYYKNMYYKYVLEHYPIWLADYSGEADYDCMIHQYSSEGKIPGIKVDVDLDAYFQKEESIPEEPLYSRSKIVDLARSWIGLNEEDSSYLKIIDIYNNGLTKYPRGVKMQPSWSWCACFWSALAINLGYTEIIPIEISCGYLVDEAKKMNCWVEDDSYIPKPGDGVLYDWNDYGSGDNLGWPDHVGIVEYVDKNTNQITVIEGNKNNRVDRRTIAINGRYIRGFIVPKYDDDIKEETRFSTYELVQQIWDGKWGNGEERRRRLSEAGYNYEEIRAAVNLGVVKLRREENERIAREVIAGKWGNGEERKQRLTNAGYSYNEIQSIVCTLSM